MVGTWLRASKNARHSQSQKSGTWAKTIMKTVEWKFRDMQKGDGAQQRSSGAEERPKTTQCLWA